jgi:hypothetical protein
MLKLDNTLLEELGLGSLPEDQKKAMLQHIYETLELRVGTNLANQMTDQQLEEFEKFIDEGGDANQAQALQWLETNLPNYKQVVNQVFEELKVEVKQMAGQIMASTTAAPSPAGTGSVQQAPYPTEPAPLPQPASYQPDMPAPAPTAAQMPNYSQPMAQPAPAYQQPAGPAPQQYYDPTLYQAAAAPVQPAPQYQQAASQPVQPMPQQVPTLDQMATTGAQQVQPSTQQPSAGQQPPQPPTSYQFPPQQPPAGPGSYQQPPQQ